MWPNSKTQLIFTHSINNNIQSIICSAESKTPIVSPMSCVNSHGVSHTNMLHLVASGSIGSAVFLLPFIYLDHSWVLCGLCCRDRSLPRTARAHRTEGQYTGRHERRTQCPSSRCSTDSAPWCIGRSRCTGWDRRLREDVWCVSRSAMRTVKETSEFQTINHFTEDYVSCRRWKSDCTMWDSENKIFYCSCESLDCKNWIAVDRNKPAFLWPY